METDLPKNVFISELARRYRVILLGGMAVIAHGLSRHTKDFDVWLEPFASPEEWAAHLKEVYEKIPGAQLWSLARRCIITPEEAADEVAEFGVLRVQGFGLPVDVFRKPNETELEAFEGVWAAATSMDDGVRLPDVIDLYLTKVGTGRAHDWDDQAFLEAKAKTRLRERLPVCDVPEATDLMNRYLDPEVLGFALENPSAEVRELVLKYLHEFEAEGDPYSRDILAAWRQRQGREAT
jgi:hypothetical protein